MQVSAKEDRFHELQTGCFSLAKSERGEAETGSALNADLVVINKYPSKLLSAPTGIPPAQMASTT